MAIEDLRAPEFSPPQTGPKTLEWDSLPEAARKRLVETLRAAGKQAMSAKAPGPHMDLGKLRAALRRLRDLADELNQRALQEARLNPNPADPHGVRLFHSLMSEVVVEVGKMPLADPMGPSRLVPHDITFYVAMAPNRNLIGRALPGHGYIYYIDYDLLQDVPEHEHGLSHGQLEAWKTFVLQNMAHELTHLVQASFYPALFSDYPKGGEHGAAYKEHQSEREARWASVDLLLRTHGPTTSFWALVRDWFGDDLRRRKDNILGLIQRYRDRILNMSGSMMTADAIARKLGLTEKAMRAFMETMAPLEGRLEAIEQGASDHAECEAMLDDDAAMRKLAKLWRLADAIGKGPMSDAEALRRLKELEGMEFDEEPEPAAPAVKPEPAAPSAPPPALPAMPDPKTREHRTHEANEWNLAIELRPPSTDGTWVEVPEAPPPGFPFQGEELEDGPSIRALFQRRETWDALKEMAAHPAKRGLIQSYLLPRIVLAIGKTWWDTNKRRKSVGDAPFGLFTPEEYGKLRDEDLDKTDAGRAFIALINWHIAKILQFYLATKAPGGHIDGYIYDALKRRMMDDAGKRQGYEAKLEPICNYCRRQRPIETTPPVLARTESHQATEGGRHRVRPMYMCQTCAEISETKGKELQLKEQGLRNAKDSLRDTERQIADGYARLKADPGNAELRRHVENFLHMEKTYEPQVASFVREVDELRNDVANRRLMARVPYKHLACIRKDCEGNAVPLTFVEWGSPFWGTPEGQRTRSQLADTFGVVEPKIGQDAEDTGAGQVSETAGSMPPEWMWDVPFRCPFKHGEKGERNVVFTPRQAFGHGKADPGGRMMGGLFVDPPRTTKWRKPVSLEMQEDTQEETKKPRIEETGGETAAGSLEHLQAQEAQLENEWLAELLRQELWSQREHRARTTSEEKRATVLYDAMYKSFIELSYLDPQLLTKYFTGMKLREKQMVDPQGQVTVVVDPVTGKETKKKTKIPMMLGDLPSGVAEAIESPVVQKWFSSILRRPEGNGLALLEHEKKATEDGGGYLTTYSRDRVWPNGYFLAQVRMGKDNQLEAPCEVVSNSPSRGSGYKVQPYMALVLGIWDHDGVSTPEQRRVSIGRADGKKLATGKASRMSEMESHDPRRIRFDPRTTLKPGDSIVVQALMMPWHSAWRPLRMIKNLRQGSESYMTNAKRKFPSIQRFLQPQPGDEDELLRARNAFRDKSVPEQLRTLNKVIIKRLREKAETPEDKMLLERLEKLEESAASRKAALSADLVVQAADPLAKYKGKRKFDETPEPEGKAAEGGNKHRFVIQLHHAKKAGDHYDLRLENEDGALSSWSIPKHRLPKGKEKLLAVKTEDHPVEYLKFKGEIPAGEYGAGTMEIHDSGTYEEIEAGKTKIVFRLKGKKEKGTYKLFRAGEGNKWLITPLSDEEHKKEASDNFPNYLEGRKSK